MATGYFSRIPNLWYDLSGDSTKNATLVKNIFFRVAIIDSVLSNSAVYYPYYVNNGETPETIAFRYYKDVTKHWIVMLANKVIDPHYDWPLSYLAFINYVTNKYGSLAQAQTQIHDYQKIVQKQDSATGNITTNTFTIDQTTYNNTPQFAFQQVNLQDGTTVALTTTTKIRYCFDYENQVNEAKKNIILIDKTFLDQIDGEFTRLTKS